MTVDLVAAAKKVAATYAVNNHVHNGMALGLGSGTTALYAVTALAERIANEGLTLRAIVATSRETTELALKRGIPLDPELNPAFLPLDVTIDGADEADPHLTLIKGGGGASLREKLVAVATTREIIVVHSSKKVDQLGLTFPLPVVIVPYGWRATAHRVEELIGRPGKLREKNGEVFVTDDGLYVFDVAPGLISDAAGLESSLKSLAGVVDVGLFVDIARLLVVGHSDGSVEEHTAV